MRCGAQSVRSRKRWRPGWLTATTFRRGHQRGPSLVRLPALTVLKAELYRQLRETGITRAELSRRLGWKRESVDRLVRLDHASRLEQLEAAFAALGQAVSVSVHAAA
jgi:antitoxin HicB